MTNSPVHEVRHVVPERCAYHPLLRPHTALDGLDVSYSFQNRSYRPPNTTPEDQYISCSDHRPIDGATSTTIQRSGGQRSYRPDKRLSIQRSSDPAKRSLPRSSDKRLSRGQRSSHSPKRLQQIASNKLASHKVHKSKYHTECVFSPEKQRVSHQRRKPQRCSSAHETRDKLYAHSHTQGRDSSHAQSPTQRQGKTTRRHIEFSTPVTKPPPSPTYAPPLMRSLALHVANMPSAVTPREGLNTGLRQAYSALHQRARTMFLD